MREETAPKRPISVQVITPDQRRIPAEHDPEKNCYVARIDRIRRSWETGYTDIRNYDDFELRLENPGDHKVRVPLLIDFRDVANITGLVPMLCDTNGVPTGMPVQLSKNWHDQRMGEYLRAYVLAPAGPGHTNYVFRVVYGFYGTLPSASHAQLSVEHVLQDLQPASRGSEDVDLDAEVDASAGDRSNTPDPFACI